MNEYIKVAIEKDGSEIIETGCNHRLKDNTYFIKKPSGYCFRMTNGEQSRIAVAEYKREREAALSELGWGTVYATVGGYKITPITKEEARKLFDQGKRIWYQYSAGIPWWAADLDNSLFDDFELEAAIKESYCRAKTGETIQWFATVE